MSAENDSDVSILNEKIIYNFRQDVESDVTFHVSGHEFHCHKMMLAVKCDYFAAMFNSEFKENNASSIPIHADPIAFKHLMQIIYDGKIENDEDIFLCSAYEKLEIENAELNEKMFKSMAALFELADRFLLTEVVRYAIESALLRFDLHCPHDKRGCYHCATKLLLALCFNMNYYKRINVSSREAVTTAIDRVNADSMNLSSKALTYLLDLN